MMEMTGTPPSHIILNTRNKIQRAWGFALPDPTTHTFMTKTETSPPFLTHSLSNHQFEARVHAPIDLPLAHSFDKNCIPYPRPMTDGR